MQAESSEGDEMAKRTRSEAIDQAIRDGATFQNVQGTKAVSLFRPSHSVPDRWGFSVAFQSSLSGSWENGPWIQWNHDSLPVGAYPVIAPGAFNA